MVTSIIILTYNKLEYTKRCIESIRRYTDEKNYELIVVDNCSTDGTKEWLQEQKQIITIFNDENFGFPKGCNQGLNVATGENVLLLNNDTIVTENWLDNLISCLYSSEEIGAVSAVSNSCAYYQTIETSYNNLEEMQRFAVKFNASDSSKWEERLKLIGFCMLIKKEVVNKVGMLDEIFSPGNYEDDDYSMRIRKAGFKLMLSKDTFIHHYGGTSFKENKEFSKLLKRNEAKFKEKWGFTSAQNMELNRNLADLIERDDKDKFNVLQIGCGCGATLLYLKNKYENIKLYGVDINRKALKQAVFLEKALDEDIYNIDKIYKYFAHVKFDYIFINDILQANNKNNKILAKLKKLLINKGRIFVESKSKDFEQKKENTNRKINEENLIELLKNQEFKDIDGVAVKDEFRLREYIIYADSIENEEKKLMENLKDNNVNIDIKRKLKFLLRRIENGIEVEESREEVYSLTKNKIISLEDILFCVEKDMIKKDDVYNSIAVKFYSESYYDNVIPLFQAAYEFNNNNVDAIYNLAYFLYDLGERKLALTYFEKIEGMDEEVDKLILELRKAIK